MGLEKFTGPLASPPPWLSRATEQTHWKKPAGDIHRFIAKCVDVLLGLGVPILGALDIVANVISEIGWDESFAFWNLGGVKATQGWALRYKSRTGRDAPWWRTHGNVGTGDAQTVFYRAYASLEDFLDEWVRTFVPRPGTVPDNWLYERTGELFWSGGDWFPELVARGYKGPVTARKPARAIHDHDLLEHSAAVRWAQSRLHVDVDGNWGEHSRDAALAFQREHGIDATGLPDAPTLEALAALTQAAVAA
jgi:hypothetical protein